MATKKLLLVSPLRKDQTLYPHLQYVIDELAVHYDIDYSYVYIRGGNVKIEMIINQLLTRPFLIKAYKPLFYAIKDIINLYRKSWQQKYDSILCIDNFPYVLTSFVFKQKSILWSHDFVGYDEIHYFSFASTLSKLFKDVNLLIPLRLCSAVISSIFQRLVVKLTRRFITKNNSLIIQDEERLNLFLKSIKFDGKVENTFFLPVSLMPVRLPKNPLTIESKLPVLMQTGAISFGRYSDKLIESYQQNFDKFKLFLHGVILNEIFQLLDHVEVLPLISSQMVSAYKVAQLIQLCDIGFISYGIGDLNHLYIKNASGQLVEFIRCGKPVIVHGETNLTQYVEEIEIGVSIRSIDQLVPAIRKIRDNYGEYSSNCIKTFEESYNLKKYMANFLLFLQE